MFSMSHSSQCHKLRQAQSALEDLLCRKRKQGKLVNPNVAWERLHPSKFPRSDKSPDVTIDRVIPTEVPPNQHASIESEVPPHMTGPMDITPQAPFQSAPPGSSRISSCPTYKPTLGRYRDEHDLLPEAPPEPFANVETSAASSTPTPTSRIRRVRLRVNPDPEPYTTLRDSFGQYRVYPSKPHSVPDSSCELNDVSEILAPTNPQNPPLPHSVSDIVFPCPNISAFRLQYWHWIQGDKKTRGSREALVRDVISAPDFVPSDIIGLNWRQMDKSLASDSCNKSSGWKRQLVPIKIPPRTSLAAAEYKSNPSRNILMIPNLEHRSLTSIVIDAFTKNKMRFFHYTPYKAFCTDPHTSKTYRVYGEAYESQRMLDAHNAVQRIKLDEPCTLPRCVAMLMIFSDATQLSNFGHATAWPIRVSFGNLSKYERCKPDASNHYEVGNMPSLPVDIQEKLRNLGDGRPVPKTLLTHLRRELIHEVWKSLLDDEFLAAWRQGVIIRCADGITRRVFPRIFSYSADYPEKVLLATIRGMKSFQPCPRCLVPKAEFPNLGVPEDWRQRRELKRVDTQARNDLVAQARSIIFTNGRAVTYKGVEQLLKPQSYVPTENAFSRRLRLLGFDIFESLTVDLLHEFELGVWKSVFQHILRILHSAKPTRISEFNERFRLVPSFGDGTIRPFSEDVSDMARPAARDYEDILQCITPAIEGLLPASCEQQILTLLFVMAQWHALAKLRRHTSASVDALKHTTTRLGHELRKFRQYTSEIEVYETPKELLNRKKRARTRARPRAALKLDPDCFDEADAAAQIPSESRPQKYFNLETSKLHALGDYAEMIETVGTTDSVSTQTGELLHRHTKRRYARTNGRDYLPQMGKIERIEARLTNIQDELRARELAEVPTQSPWPTGMKLAHADEDLQTLDAGRSPYQMAMSQNNPVLTSIWSDRGASDPAAKDFMVRLKNHLLARLSNQRYQDESTHGSDQLSQIDFQHERLYAHQTLKIHYTTYDVRRAQDIINPNTPKRFVLVASDEMVGSQPGAHQFWYARVLGIYHANVSYNGARHKRMDFLWVRWLGRVLDAPGGWDTCRLDQVGYFQDSEDTHAFDFVDPIDVIRAAHLIPRFVGNRTSEHLGCVSSIATDTPLGDWKNYYINRFVDRNMLMRFIGMAIGHVSHGNTPEYTAGVSADVLESGYEYSEGLDLELGDDVSDEENPPEEVEGEQSGRETDDHSDDESDDEQMEYDDREMAAMGNVNIDDDPSW